MARTKQEISEQMQAEFISNSVLQQLYGLSGTLPFREEFSLVSLEAQIIEIVANSGKTIEDLMDVHLAEVNARLEKLTPGSLNWYKEKALEFQFGDLPVWNQNTLKYGYQTIDESKQIVKLVSVNETSEGLLFKLAKLDNSNNPKALDEPELIAFSTYMNQMKYAGVNIDYVSRPADLIRLNLRIYYDAQILNENGSLLTNSAKFPVDDAVNEFLKLLPFNGVFSVTSLIDALQKIPGVINPVFLSGSTAYGTPPSWINIVDYYLPNAGYLVVDTLNIEYVL